MLVPEEPRKITRIDWQANFVTKRAEAVARLTEAERQQRIRPPRDKSGRLIIPTTPPLTDEEILEEALATIASAEKLLKETVFLDADFSEALNEYILESGKDKPIRERF